MDACHICDDGSEKQHVGEVSLIGSGPYELVRCHKCKCIYCNPLPGLAALDKHYSSMYHDYDNHKEEGRGLAFAKKLRKIKGRGKILDIGCSAGFFIYGIRNNSNWDVYGTEFGDDIVRFANDVLSLNVKKCEANDTGYDDNSFDFIHIEDALEHVTDPMGLLGECKRILEKDGVFHLSVPNEIADASDIQTYNTLYNKPARTKAGHIFYFQPDTIRYMTEKTGFVIIDARTYDFKNGLRSYGLLPRKKSWSADLNPDHDVAATVSNDIHKRGRRKSSLYYRWRFFKDTIRKIPGIYRWGANIQYTFGLRRWNPPCQIFSPGKRKRLAENPPQVVVSAW